MKRIALTLMAVALTGAMAYAQDAAPVVKFSGYVNDGPKIVSNSNGTTYSSYANDYGYAGSIARLTASLTGANYGYVLAPIIKNGVASGFDTAYGWVSPLAGLRLEAGTGNSNPLGELDDAGKGYFSESGVTAFYTAGPVTAGAVVSPSATGTKAGTQLTFGARLSLPDLLTVNATAGTNTASSLDAVYVTAKVSAVKALTLTGGYNSTGIASTASSFIDATLGYAVTDA